ncbi:hypothetical protein COU77_00420 [Candidatus Peregrinibacteria bacterium CG10_big_fil_rev_8_21_14_0_10_49_16]|nr:MAG: hypothetical protein COW95_00435 [Candidatus Peregrinibacteria bacterium CG22_combo_CG10-13_8_21_14_all_49_11]PIR52410.1 MAG: hypothetical protein COU77_00420 [Candidatus Peregrinibacteria bacterium CG10_big_fil_rev_8_21_14_0_10_49_16]
MKVSLIAAASENNVIGKSGHLPWDLPDDRKYFRDATKGKPVIMGRKTYESLPENIRPMPDRRNIVITRDKARSLLGCDTVSSLEEALLIAEQDDPDEVFVIGGGDIYHLALPIADRIYLTRVHADIDGDTYFPEVDGNEWKEVMREEHGKDEKHEYAFTYLMYDRL